MADVYIEIISAQKLKVGVLPTTDDWIANRQIEKMQFNELHWIAIENHTSDQCDLFSGFLRFMIGMIHIPSQMGHFMTDWGDLRTALQYGYNAMYIRSNELNEQSWFDSKTILSSMMLLNEDLTMRKKFEIAAGLIPRSPANNDYLTIMNMTNSNHFPQTNMLLLVYKKLVKKTNHGLKISKSRV